MTRPLDAAALDDALALAPDLAIVIPVWNLPQDLEFLLGQVADLGIFSQVVVVDDGSEPACDPRLLGFDEARLGARLTCLRINGRRGAGHARNMGLAQVTTGNVLFFDSDDHLSPGLDDIWRDHIADPDAIPDFTIFRHSDTRVEQAEGREGSFAAEERRWDHAMGDDRTRLLDQRDRARLCAISAYPWNKIYRTDFLRRNAIDCSETPVHNDIRLHWLSFAHAGRVLATRRIGAVHVVGQRDHHLTTRRGAERFCLFGIIQDLLPRLRRKPLNPLLMRQFIHFTDNLCQWNLDQLEPALLASFRERTCRAYLDFHPEEFALFARWNPDQAGRMVEFLIQEGF